LHRQTNIESSLFGGVVAAITQVMKPFENKNHTAFVMLNKTPLYSSGGVCVNALRTEMRMEARARKGRGEELAEGG